MTDFKFRSTQDWDEDRYPRIAGRITTFDSVKDGERDARFAVVDTPEGVFRVFYTFQLEEAFSKAAVGDGVFVEFLGEKQLKAAKRIRLFNVQVWTWNDREGIPQQIRALVERGVPQARPARVESYVPPTA